MKTSKTIRRWLRILTMLSPGVLISPETVARDLQVESRIVREDFEILVGVAEIDSQRGADGRLGLSPSGYRRLISFFRRAGEIDW